MDYNGAKYARFYKVCKIAILSDSWSVTNASHNDRYGCIGVLTTGATMVLFNQPIWDPVLLAIVYIPVIAKIPVLLGIFGLTFSVNILANTISSSL